MTYTFVNISAVKFSINGRELYKTFIPYFVNDNVIKILNVYDSSCPLVDSRPVNDFVVDGVTFTDATALSNAIHTVIFSRNVEAVLNNAQIETNRLAIIDLQNGKADTNHNHNDLYYTKTEIDNRIDSIVSSSDLLGSGAVDGNKIIFKDQEGTTVFDVDASTFLAQGTNVSFENGVLTLKNASGETLSTTNIEAKESYYDTFKFVEGIEDDLNNLTTTSPFTLVKTVGELYFFVSNLNNTEDFEGSKIYNSNIDSFFELEVPTIQTAAFKAWSLNITTETFINDNLYRFNFWIRKKTKVGNPVVNGYTIMNAQPETTAFAVGHVFFGLNGSGAFIIGQVIALPFNINDETKVKIHLNNI